MESGLDFRTRRLLGWGVLALAFVLVNFHRISTGVLAESLMRTFETTGAKLGWLHSSFFYIYAPLQIVAGVLADQSGSRRVAIGGTIVMVLGTFSFAVSESYAMGFASRALIGLGGSVIYIATLKYCANWYRDDEFATMTGFTLSAAAVGGLMATTPLAILVDALDWRTAFVIVGVAGLAVTIVVVVFVRDSPTVAGYSAVEGSVDQPDLTIGQTVENAKVVLSERGTWIMGGLLFFAVGTNYTVMGLWGVPYLVHTYGLSVETASLFTLAGNVGLLLGSPTIGWISDRLGRRTSITVVTAVLYALLYGTISLLATPPLLFVGAAFFGTMFLHGGFLLMFTVIKERHSGATSGTATGTINAMGFFGAAVLPGIMGIALDTFWIGKTVAGSRVYTEFGYQVAFGIAAASGLVALVCASWLHWNQSTSTETRAA